MSSECPLSCKNLDLWTSMPGKMINLNILLAVLHRVCSFGLKRLLQKGISKTSASTQRTAHAQLASSPGSQIFN